MIDTLDALHSLIAGGESLTLELKKSTAEKDRACRSVCALANGQGGHVVFGVTPTGKVVDTPALPVEAVREALANAFVHRDYTSAAGSVSIALYDDRLEVISPGELHFGLTPEMLYQPHESKPWNPWIAKVFYRRGLIETWGRGTLKMATLMQEDGLAAPSMKFRLPDPHQAQVAKMMESRMAPCGSGILPLLVCQSPRWRFPERR